MDLQYIFEIYTDNIIVFTEKNEAVCMVTCKFVENDDGGENLIKPD